VVLEGIGSADFAKAPEAIPVGEAAARRAAPALARYSLPPEEYARWRASLGKLAAAARPTIDEVRLLGFNRTNPDVMRNLIDARPGEPYDPEASTRDAARLVARRDYTSISYDLVPEGDRNVLVYRATEKPWGPRYLKFDLNMSTDGKANTAWGVRGNYEQRWLNALGGEFRADAQLGRPNLLQAEFYQPVDPRLRFFVAPSVQWKQTLEYVYSGDKPRSQVDLKRYSLGLDAGVALGTWGEWRIGVQRGHSSLRNKVGDAPLPDEGQFDIGAATMRLAIDTLDQRLFPRHGYFGSLNALVSRTSLGASRDYKLVSGSAGKAFELENGVVTVALRGGTDLNTDAPYYDQFRLGGMFNFSGYTDGQLVGREYGLAGVMYRRRLTYLAESLGTAIYGGVTAELGQVYERADGTRVNGLQPAGSIFLGIDSKIGPVYFAYGRAPGGHSAIYLYVGSSFEAFRP
jgi:NTE family protein